MTALRGILFDKDGVLFDFQATWGVWAARMIADLAGSGTAADRIAERLDFDRHAERFRPTSFAIAGTADAVARVFIEALPQHPPEKINAHLLRGASEAAMVPAAPLAEVFGTLRGRGLRIGLATNDSERAARANLTGQGVLGLFDFVAGSDSGYGAKPAPGMCLAFADTHGLRPEDCAMVGDSTHDMEAARAAGFKRIGVLTGVADAKELAPHADVVLPSIAALPRWLDGAA